jgi:GTP cyclohydrolase I
MQVRLITFDELNLLVANMANEIHENFPDKEKTRVVYPVPRGGVPVALALMQHMEIVLTDDPDKADFIVDDLQDSGATCDRFWQSHPKTCFFTLIDKRKWAHGEDWVVWPWEQSAEKSIEDNIIRLLQYIGENPTRGGLLETPARVAKAWAFWGSGYGVDPASVLKTFEDGAEGTDEMVLVKDIPFYTHCEHHMAPFFGTATIAYLPDKRIVGLSKLSRVLQIYARRLQVQERLTCQVADALMEHLQPLGCGVVVKARHLCMESRGICQQGHHTVTSALRGIFTDDASVRAEFLGLAR